MEFLLSMKRKYVTLKISYAAPKILSQESRDKISNLLNHGIIFEPTDGSEYSIIATYYLDVKQNFDIAKIYYLKAIEYLEPTAMNNLAVCYECIKKNYEKAEHYYKMAIEHDNGHLSSLYNLAIYYMDVKKDYENAKIYFTKAMNYNDPDIMNGFGVLCEKIKKYKKAETYFMMAISLSNKFAAYNLAKYFFDFGRFQDAKRAFLMASHCYNDTDSMIGLALCYKNRQKYGKAETSFLNAINNGNISAMIYLGKHYVDISNYVEAEYYFLMAINNNDTSAVFCLALMYDKIQKIDSAKYYYLMAINNYGSKASMLCLADIYMSEKNYEDAERYYFMAIDHDFIDVRDVLIQHYKNKLDYHHRTPIDIDNLNSELMNTNSEKFKCILEILLICEFLPNNEISTIVKQSRNSSM